MDHELWKAYLKCLNADYRNSVEYLDSTAACREDNSGLHLLEPDRWCARLGQKHHRHRSRPVLEQLPRRTIAGSAAEISGSAFGRTGGDDQDESASGETVARPTIDANRLLQGGALKPSSSLSSRWNSNQIARAACSSLHKSSRAYSIAVHLRRHRSQARPPHHAVGNMLARTDASGGLPKLRVFRRDAMVRSCNLARQAGSSAAIGWMPC